MIAVSHTQIEEMVDGWGIIVFPGSRRPNVVHLLNALLKVTSPSKNVFCLEASQHKTCEILGRDPKIQNPKALYIPYKKRGPSVCRPPYGIVLLTQYPPKGTPKLWNPQVALGSSAEPPEGAVGGSLDDRLAEAREPCPLNPISS